VSDSECTGVAATWCPVCGDCTCGDRTEFAHVIDESGCPLHAADSGHAEQPADTRDPLRRLVEHPRLRSLVFNAAEKVEQNWPRICVNAKVNESGKQHHCFFGATLDEAIAAALKELGEADGG